MDYRQINIAMECLCVILCAFLAVYLYMDRQSKERSDRWFIGMVFSCLFIILGDMTDWALSGRDDRVANLVLWTGSCLFYVASAAMIFTFMGYLIARIEGKGVQVPRELFRCSAVLSAVVALMAAVSPLTGWVFTVSPVDNAYHRGELFPLSQILTYLVYLLSGYVLVRYRSVLRKREKMLLWTISVGPLAAQLVQAWNYGLALVPVTICLALVLGFIFIQSELKLELEKKNFAIQRAELEHMEQLRNNQTAMMEQIFLALSNAVEAKDRYTSGHSQRVASYCRELVKRMGWSEKEQREVYYAGILHDVGKIRVADTIINKTDRLTDAEYEEMKLHTLAGYYILKKISAVSQFAVGARWHHERYDGTGYPNGLSGENIPLIARVIAVADAYDAMTSTRSYREIMTQQRVREELERGMGTQFDPKIAQIMLDMIDEDTDYTMRQPQTGTEWTILAVDDDPMVLKFVEFTLKKVPLYRLLTATSGREGEEILMREKVDLVLMDVEMPGMDGFAVLAWIREHMGSLPVIFMTGDKELELIQKAEAMGVSDYRTKPLETKLLLESIQSVLPTYPHRGQKGCGE